MVENTKFVKCKYDILVGQKLILKAKNSQFWRAFENLKFSVKQCYQTIIIGQKLVQNAKMEKIKFLVILNNVKRQDKICRTAMRDARVSKLEEYLMLIFVKSCKNRLSNETPPTKERRVNCKQQSYIIKYTTSPAEIL